MLYDLAQTILLLSLAAGRAENVWGDKEKITDFFRKAIDEGGPWTGSYGRRPTADTIPEAQDYQVAGLLAHLRMELTGDWRVVWGPCVYVAPGEETLANGMYVAHSERLNLYVVAISPTNFASHYAVYEEDYNVRPDRMVNFPIGSPVAYVPVDRSKPQVSAGTANGLRILLDMHNDRGGSTLLAFLNSRRPNLATKLVFAGHSLGGALAPALALQLIDSLDAAWIRSNVAVFSTAGPTPGNAEFAAKWRLQFRRISSGWDVPSPGNPFMRDYNVPYWNTYDPVPYAWNNVLGWYEYKPGEPPSLDTKIAPYTGSDADAVNARYRLQNDAGLACGMAPLHEDSDHAELTDGPWPVKFLDHRVERLYPRPEKFENQPALLTGQGMVHGNQYYQIAGIDPWKVPEPALPIAS